MGNALGVSGLSVLASIAFVVAAILTIVAMDRLKSIAGYSTNDSLQDANNHLTVAMILGWIAAGLAFILMLGYLLTNLKILNNEWLHFILWLLGMAAAVITIIYLGLALRKVPSDQDDQSTREFILWSMILTGVGLVIFTFLGLWRMTHHATKPEKKKASDTSNDYSTYNYNTTSDYDIPPPVSGYTAEKPSTI